MDFKEKLLASHLAFEERIDHSDPVHQMRLDALEIFEKKGFPSRRDEAWKFTSLGAAVSQDYALFPEAETTIQLKKVKKYFLYEIDTYKVVFIDGVYSPFLSDTTHDGLDVCLMSAALSKAKYRSLIDTYFDKITNKEDSLTALNTSYTLEGAYVYIPKSVVAEKPIEIIHFSSGQEKALWLQPRNLIVVDQNAQVQILERHQSLKEHDVVTNSVTEIYTHQDAFVDYYKIQNDLMENHHRLAMIELAIGGKSKLKACSEEFDLPTPNYTIQTLNHLKKKYLKNQFTLILGQDNMEHFDRWKEYHQILKQFQIFVYPRSQSNKIPETFLDHPKVVYFKAPLLNISATEIRDALVKKKLLVDFLPPKIQDYLLKFNFYN